VPPPCPAEESTSFPSSRPASREDGRNPPLLAPPRLRGGDAPISVNLAARRTRKPAWAVPQSGMAHGESRGKSGSCNDFLSPGRGDIIATGRVGFLCRPDQIGAHALLCAARSHGFRRGPHYCAANAASDDAEALKLTLMGLALSSPSRGGQGAFGSKIYWIDTATASLHNGHRSRCVWRVVDIDPLFETLQPSCHLRCAPVAQLDRALAYEARGIKLLVNTFRTI